jgi:GTPase SAR1 family protein
MTPDRGPAQQRGTSDRYVVSAQVALAITSVLAVLLSVTDRFLTDRRALVDLGIGALVAIYVAGMVLVARRLLRTRYYDFRIALTGQPSVGKTVFANLLYDQLMNGNDPDYEFTAESKSAIATHQAIRGITQDEWPPSTARGSVLQRDGVLRHRRVRVDLEIGDSAGQHWLDLSTTDGDSREADYLQWVLSAHALVHVIPADGIGAEGFVSVLQSDLEDLRLAAQLMRSVARGRYMPVPILIVISKLDLALVDLVQSDLMRIFSSAEAPTLESTRRLAAVYETDVPELLMALSHELLGDFRSVLFTYASTATVTQLRKIGAPRRPDIAAWVVGGASSHTSSRFLWLRSSPDAPRRRQ